MHSADRGRTASGTPKLRDAGGTGGAERSPASSSENLDHRATRWHAQLTSLIEGAAIENRDLYSVGNPIHGQFAGGIESKCETQAAALAKPEKHWALARSAA